MAGHILELALQRFIGCIEGKEAIATGCIHNHVDVLNYISSCNISEETNVSDELVLCGFLHELRKHYNLRGIGPHEEYYLTRNGEIKIRPMKEFFNTPELDCKDDTKS